VLRNHHDAEDATQEAFMRVLRYRRKLAGVKDTRAWLARIAWRVAVERRKKVPEVSLQVTLEDVSETVSQLRSKAEAADNTLLAQELADLTGKLIATLPTELRDAITLSTVQEMGAAQIATVLGVNEAAVRSRIFRARQILREKLAAVLGTL
jgi:RNA polymerase sigma-70 factor, ECF subfamily